MRKYKLFQDEVLGYGFDIDGWFSWQCWDGYAKYCVWLGVPFANCTVSGFVKDIWEQRYTNGMLDYFDEMEAKVGSLARTKVELRGLTVSGVCLTSLLFHTLSCIQQHFVQKASLYLKLS